MADRFPATVIPVLGGRVPGVTVTVRSVEFPGITGFGLAAPVPEGLFTPLQVLVADAEFRGLGAPVAKSARLLSVSVQPLLVRKPAVVLLSVGAAAPSKKLAFPYPTKSMILASSAAGQGVEPPLQASPVVVLTNATLPAPALMVMVPVTSGVGNATPIAPPDASFIR